MVSGTSKVGGRGEGVSRFSEVIMDITVYFAQLLRRSENEIIRRSNRNVANNKHDNIHKSKALKQKDIRTLTVCRVSELNCIVSKYGLKLLKERILFKDILYTF